MEVINDKNGNIINFYRVLKTKFEELKSAIDGTMYSRATYKHAMVVYDCPYLFNDVVRAWALWVCTIQGFSNKIGSWRGASNRTKEAKTHANKKDLITDVYSERLRTVIIEENDAIKMIQRHDAEDVFFYIDPPYVDSNQGHYGGYTQEHFNELLDILSNIKGKFLLSSYPNAELQKYTEKHAWKSKSVEMHLSASGRGKRKVEMLTYNYELSSL